VRNTSFRISILALGLAIAAALVPMASATTCPTGDTCFNLSANNLGISGSIGYVTIANTATNQVTVTITMNSGFSVKLNGGDIAFNGPSSLSVVSLSADSNTGLSFKNVKTNQNISQFGKFSFDFTNVKGQPGGVVSANVVTLVLTGPGLVASDFTGIAIHFCTASGSNCGPNTGFATDGGGSTVPEPGTLSLLGTGLIGLAGAVRRRFSK
jgi:hypothetical protein